ncbi:MAG: SUF system Fe-S cluster assembly regulator [Sumerlaeia bacterium]
MIRITKQTDYALVLLGQFISPEAEVPYSAKRLSYETQLPEPIVGKILKILSTQGILSSVRGASGGYILAVDPEVLSIADVLEAVEGPIMLTDCSCPDGQCEYKTRCPLKENFRHINNALRQAFRSISLRMMTTPLGNDQIRDFAETLNSSLNIGECKSPNFIPQGAS